MDEVCRIVSVACKVVPKVLACAGASSTTEEAGEPGGYYPQDSWEEHLAYTVSHWAQAGAM